MFMKLIGRIGRTRLVMAGAGAALVLAMAVIGAADKPVPGARAAAAPVRIETAVARRGDVPIYADGLGTVQAYYTVAVTPRVDGQLLRLGFVEGQMVKPGDMLAQIDPRPYQAAYDQAIAAKFKDAALLANARRDLERYVKLAPEEFTSQQTLETQRALVAQLQAQIIGDQAAIDNAATQLDYTTIRSPIEGRTGIRMTDPGNIVHAATATGIVVVTQVQPISLIFTLPGELLHALNRALAAGPVAVTALSRDGKQQLGIGTVGLVDNQIDQTTGTIRLKATFQNRDNLLWPGDFVNAHVLVSTRHDALTIPSTAVQRGPRGLYAYVVTAADAVEMRPLEVGQEVGTVTVIEKGLQEGERVATSNHYRLQPGARVQVAEPAQGAAKPAAEGKAQ